MDLQPEIRDLKPQSAVAIRTTVDAQDIGALIHRELPGLIQKLLDASVPVEHPPYIRYFTTGQTMDVELGVPFDGEAPDPGGFEVVELPGGRIAVLRHAGSYEKLRDSWEWFGNWAREQGEGPNGAFWESYFTNPREEADPEKIYTDLYLPLK